MSENRPFADVLPSRASAVWTVPFARDSWERLSTAAEPFKTFVAAFIASFTEGRAERVAIGPVLTDAPHPATAIFYAEHPTDSTSRDEVLCAVSISPRPTDDLPGELVVASHALKGWRGLASVVKDVCSSTEVPPVAMYVLDFK